ncbi:indolepyruvate oxidoreductase subunit beta [Raoultibacter phocaeensis]|uniref:indolepyruvate oxidoreductase subunit beta n=1 Tax=Raoultibacter phocaeensis TaxID=2479841 RepID=UPI0015D6038D|nr:indolepyruvate oxidoreductase subunit beta [Raoultibacter phocaeensis]
MSANQTNATTVLLCGVGGQGTILAADLLAKTAIAAGLSVKLSEVHGMSQRGGAVTTIVRFGESVPSMVTDLGCADRIVAFETTEALRNLPYLKEGGLLLVNDESIKPLPVLTGSASMPQRARERLLEAGAHLIEAGSLAVQAGSAKSANVVLLGALAAGMAFDPAVWEEQIALRVPPRTVDVNIAAFRAGMQSQGVRA